MTADVGQVEVDGRCLPGVWLVDLPFEKPISLNDHTGRPQVTWARKKQWREKTADALREAGVPRCERIRLTLFYVPKVNRRRDEDNLVASMKPVADALVDAGVVDDDTAEYVERVWPVYLPKDPLRSNGRFMVQVERLA
jgi:crossover junction endodeoxyribonuclease RusA